MVQSENGFVLITGATRGIGSELAKVFGREGYPLVLVARDAERLEKLAAEIRERHGVSVKTAAKDLTQASSVRALYEELVLEQIVVEILVNNAAFGVHGVFYETDLAAGLDTVRLNAEAVTHLTRLFLPSMVARRQGKILNVASTAAFQPGPLLSVYYATKAYVLSFSEALASELQGTGVTLTVLCPGATRTGFQKTANLKGIFLARDNVMMDARKVAEVGYHGLMKGKTIVIPGWMNKVTPILVRLAPRRLVCSVVRMLHEKS